MSDSYPRRDQARGIWKINDITKNVKGDGTYPNSNTGAVRAIWMGGGAPGNSNVIDYFQTSTAGNAVDFGDLSLARSLNAGGGSFTRGLCCGGSPTTDVIDYIHFASTGNAADFGNLTAARAYLAGMSNNIRCLSVDGLTPSRVNTIDTVNIATLGNATDFGDSQTATALPTCTASPTRGIKAGGNTPSNIDTIDFYELSTTGNGVDFGNLTSAKRSQSSFGSQTRMVMAGTNAPGTQQMETIQFQSQGNAIDYGDALSGTTENGRGTSNTILGLFARGSVSNVIEQKIIASAANATDFGDLTVARTAAHATSNGHGGLEIFNQRSPELYSPTGKVVPKGLGVGDIGVFGGGLKPANSNVIDFITISADGNSVDFGDVTATDAFNAAAAAASDTRGIFAGGFISPTNINSISYVTISTKGNNSDFGDLTVARRRGTGASNQTRAVMIGGHSPSVVNTIDYITIATIGDATDFGDATSVISDNAGLASSTRGISGGGQTAPANTNIIQYVTIASTGNATDFGDLTEARRYLSGCSSSVRGVFYCGNQPGASSVIDYITIASTGNATDFGDPASTPPVDSFGCGVSNNTRGVFAGRASPRETIEKVTIASTGNATDYGDLSTGRNNLAGFANGHGGLS